MILFRALFWLGVAVVVVPANYFEAAQTKFYEVAPIVVSAVGEQVATAIFDATNTCAERPDICDAAKDLFTATSRTMEDQAENPVVRATHDEAI